MAARQIGEGRPAYVAAIRKRAEAEAARARVANGVRPVQGGDSDPVAAWINKAVGANPEKLNAVVAKMTEAQLNKVLDTLDGKQFIGSSAILPGEITKLRGLRDTLAKARSGSKQDGGLIEAGGAGTQRPVAPGAHRAKEEAKLENYDLVLAPVTAETGYAGNLARWAQSQGKLYVPKMASSVAGKRILVSVPGEGRGFTSIDAMIHRAKGALDAGAILITDNEANAMRPHNINGEGALRKALIEAGYVETSAKLFSTWSKAVSKLVESSK